MESSKVAFSLPTSCSPSRGLPHRPDPLGGPAGAGLPEKDPNPNPSDNTTSKGHTSKENRHEPQQHPSVGFLPPSVLSFLSSNDKNLCSKALLSGVNALSKNDLEDQSRQSRRGLHPPQHTHTHTHQPGHAVEREQEEEVASLWKVSRGSMGTGVWPFSITVGILNSTFHNMC